MLLFVVNDAPFFVSHRLPIAIAARRQGFQVHLAAPAPCPAAVAEEGIVFHPLRMSRSGTNLLGELSAILQLQSLFGRLRPDLVHAITIKPVLYGAIAARLARVRALVLAISGLGPAFRGSGWRSILVRRLIPLLYRLALGHPRLRVVFQNPDDRAVLSAIARLRREQTILIPGSGVDLGAFVAVPEPDGPPVVLMASRLVRDKGPETFVAAARLLRRTHPDVRFLLAGAPDPHSPGSIREETLRQWAEDGVVELLGQRSDIPELIAHAHLVVHPSVYGEGLPKILIEAAAGGRAVITTDHPGCRDAVLPEETGLLVPGGDAEALAAAIGRLLDDTALRRRLGVRGRRLAEERYGLDGVVETHLAIYEDLLGTEA